MMGEYILCIRPKRNMPTIRGLQVRVLSPAQNSEGHGCLNKHQKLSRISFIVFHTVRHSTAEGEIVKCKSFLMSTWPSGEATVCKTVKGV